MDSTCPQRSSPNLARLLIQRVDLGPHERDPRRLPLALRQLLHLAREVYPLHAGGLVRSHHPPVQIQHALPELLQVHEQVRLDGHQEVAHVGGLGRVVGIRDVAGKGGPGQDSGKDIHHDGQGRALWPAHGQHHAPQRGLRVVGRTAVRVQRPVRRDPLAPPLRLVDLAPGRHRRRHVQDEALQVALAGGSAGNRRDPHELLPAAPRSQRRARVCKDQAHHVRIQSLLHHPRAHAKVVRVLDARQADAVRLRRLDRRGHARPRRHKPKAVASVDLGHHGRHLRHLGLRTGIQDPLPDTLHVRRDAVHAMRIDASEIGSHEASCYDGGIVSGDAVAPEDVLHQAAGFRGGDEERLGLEQSIHRRLGVEK
ncbi:Positive regulator of purine utilization [Trichoderma cornu-damae]|uniref:Positive regulator of purine utilization n=1 Tax=Trichoderma cornu-damae TaxID=654480 RepID=A0A9P8TT48_9HYPO|nr:Positive regulator of purine utilization [Trichoderma cornu-damae]